MNLINSWGKLYIHTSQRNCSAWLLSCRKEFSTPNGFSRHTLARCETDIYAATLVGDWWLPAGINDIHCKLNSGPLACTASALITELISCAHACTCAMGLSNQFCLFVHQSVCLFPSIASKKRWVGAWEQGYSFIWTVFTWVLSIWRLYLKGEWQGADSQYVGDLTGWAQLQSAIWKIYILMIYTAPH